MGKLNRRKFCLACGKRIFGMGNYCQGHDFRTKPKVVPNHHPCECGCGELVGSDKTYVWGHNGVGFHRTEETKEKLRGPKTEEQKIKLRHPRSKEGAEANKNAQNTLSAKKNHRKALLNRYEDLTERDKQSRKVKEFWSDPEKKEKRSLAIKNGWSDQELRDRHSEAQSISQNRPEQKENHSIKQILNWQDPIYKTNQLLAIGKGLCRLPNNPETLIDLITHEYFTGWKYTGDYSIVIGGKNPDFVNEETKQIIEVYGDHWHRDEDPTIKAELYYQAGYELCVIWEHELHDLDEVIMKLRRFCGREF
jgi:very-short-patch-repair endonuclease